MRITAVIFYMSLVCACGTGDSSSNNVQQPNILMLLADDMGYGDLGSYGGKASTPHLDYLADGGLRFTNFYAGGPNCSPSRAALMTGRSPARVGMYSYRPSGHPMHLRDEEITIAEVLAEDGYQTAHIGKWHLGCLPQDAQLMHPQPDQQGFSYSLGTENNARPSHLNPINFVRNGRNLDTMSGYSCQILAKEVEHWFEKERSDSKPFFMYVAFHEPHAKIASPPEMIAHYPGESEKDAEYFANIENLDNAIGRILTYLHEHQLFENTLILFASDNGSYRHASNGGLRAVKSYVYEGGIRVPGIIHWKNIIPGSIHNQAIGFVDVFPTICDLLNIDVPTGITYDGQSFRSLLHSGEFLRENPLYWFFYRTSPEMSLRWHDHIILGKDRDTLPVTHRFSQPDMGYIKKMRFAAYELYDLRSDVNQSKNLFGDDDSTSQLMKVLIDQKLREIEKDGFYWDDLPVISDTAKYKRDWVRY